jgi:hypothetical protein
MRGQILETERPFSLAAFVDGATRCAGLGLARGPAFSFGRAVLYKSACAAELEHHSCLSSARYFLPNAVHHSCLSSASGLLHTDDSHPSTGVDASNTPPVAKPHTSQWTNRHPRAKITCFATFKALAGQGEDGQQPDPVQPHSMGHSHASFTSCGNRHFPHSHARRVGMCTSLRLSLLPSACPGRTFSGRTCCWSSYAACYVRNYVYVTGIASSHPNRLRHRA